jgi:hypothetical protein
MTDRTWRSIAVVLGLVLVFMSGFAIAFVMLPRPSGDVAGRSPSPSPGGSLRPSSIPSPTAAPTAEPSEPRVGGAADAAEWLARRWRMRRRR